MGVSEGGGAVRVRGFPAGMQHSVPVVRGADKGWWCRVAVHPREPRVVPVRGLAECCGKHLKRGDQVPGGDTPGQRF